MQTTRCHKNPRECARRHRADYAVLSFCFGGGAAQRVSSSLTRASIEVRRCSMCRRSGSAATPARGRTAAVVSTWSMFSLRRKRSASMSSSFSSSASTFDTILPIECSSRSTRFLRLLNSAVDVVCLWGAENEARIASGTSPLSSCACASLSCFARSASISLRSAAMRFCSASLSTRSPSRSYLAKIASMASSERPALCILSRSSWMWIFPSWFASASARASWTARTSLRLERSLPIMDWKLSLTSCTSSNSLVASFISSLTCAYVSLMMARNMLSSTKKTKKTYVVKYMGPSTRFANSSATKSKSPRIIRNSVKLLCAKELKSKRTGPNSR
eukprot:m.643122 g.643122  ORF g.643122 m.643122 type:complete len:332 (-) comp58347_c0_seq1:1722-2717(-)